MTKCPLTQNNEQLSPEKRLPCDLCSLIQKLGKKVVASKIILHQSHVYKDYQNMVKAFNKLDKTHKKCAGCGLCFGGDHIAKEFARVPKLGIVCQWCAKDYLNKKRHSEGTLEILNREVME